MTDSKELLQSFWDLAECDPAVRLPASSSLLAALQAQQAAQSGTDMCPNLVYTCDRLVLGLASSRKSARQGFAAMLVQLLQTFGPKTVSSSDYLARVHKSIDVSQATSPQVRTSD
jgi:DNA polymerase phi